MTPTMTPTVVIDARSNCRMAREATIHATPTTSQSHHGPLIRRMPAASSGTAIPPSSGVVAEVLMVRSWLWVDAARGGRRTGRRLCLGRPSVGVGVRQVDQRGLHAAADVVEVTQPELQEDGVDV